MGRQRDRFDHGAAAAETKAEDSDPRVGPTTGRVDVGDRPGPDVLPAFLLGDGCTGVGSNHDVADLGFGGACKRLDLNLGVALADNFRLPAD